jgi:autotransporter-associated beta strand protein
MRRISNRVRALLAVSGGIGAMSFGEGASLAQNYVVPIGTSSSTSNAGNSTSNVPGISPNPGYATQAMSSVTNVPGDPNTSDPWMDVINTSGWQGGTLITTTNTTGTVTTSTTTASLPSGDAGGNRYYNQTIVNIPYAGAVAADNNNLGQLQFSFIMPPPSTTDPAYIPNISTSSGQVTNMLSFSLGVYGTNLGYSTNNIETLSFPDTNPGSIITATVPLAEALTLLGLGSSDQFENLYGPQATGSISVLFFTTYGYNNEYNGGAALNYSAGFPEAPVVNANGPALGPADGLSLFIGQVQLSTNVNETWSAADANAGTSTTGTWSDPGNWTGEEVPEIAGDTANFSGTLPNANFTFAVGTNGYLEYPADSQVSNVTLDGNYTVGTMNFDNYVGYTITPGGGGELVLDNGGASATASINVYYSGTNVTHSIEVPLILNSNLSVMVANAGDGLAITGAISSGNPGTGLSVSGAGTVTLTGANTYSGPTAVTGGTLVIGAAGSLPSGTSVSVGGGTGSARLQLGAGTGTANISSLSIGSGGQLDITNNTLIVNYGTGADPASTIRGYLTSGYNANGVKWTGSGIVSSLAAANPSVLAVGYADGGNAIDRANTGVAAGEVEVEYTVAGDANLSGGVDLSDLVIVASDFGQTGADWAEGDVNYDGNVDLSDLVIVASNFGASLGTVNATAFGGSFAAEWKLALAEVHGADVGVPEPATFGLAIFSGAGLLARRRRSA